MKFSSWLLIFTGCLSCAATEIPELKLPEGVGVNIHFVNGHQKDLDLIQKAGFKFIRMDFGWAGIERKKGEYDWSGYDELMGNLDQRGIHAIFILDYSNPLYEESMESRNPVFGGMRKTTASPQHPESVKAFASWAAAAAKHFQGRHIIWEIWNEPNISFWVPKPDVEQYTALALATCKAIRQSVPEATIVGPASSEFPWAFLESFLKSGILEYLDGVSVHPYRNYRNSPETALADYQKLRLLIDEHAPAEKRGKLPILSGEWGYASHTKGVSRETQAAFAARQQLANLLYGVPVSIWYDWKDDGTDANEREHNFGTVQPDLTPKPAFQALQKLTTELSGWRIQRRIATANDKDYVVLFTKGSGPGKLAVWTAGEPHKIKINASAGGEVEIELGAMPVYLPY